MIETTTLSRQQLICIKTLFGKLNIEDQDAMVRGYTDLRTGKVSEMLPGEAKELIKELKRLDPDEESAEVMRKKIIALAYKRAGLPRSASKEQKQAVVNWLDGWCKKYGHKQKGLNSYTYKELPKLVTQAEIMFDKLLIEI
jgi:hypothetical protein